MPASPNAWNPLVREEKSGARQKDLKDLLVFHNVARALTSSLELDEVLRTILEQMANFFQPQTWTLLMLDEKANELYYAIAAGRAEASLADIRIPVGEGMAGWVAKHGETLIVPTIKDDPRFSSAATQGELIDDNFLSQEDFRIRSAISLPLRSKRQILGVIQLFNCDLQSLTDYTITFLHVLCDYAAISIENARAVARIQELTITDECTGLYNLRHLYSTLEVEIQRARRFGQSFSLIFVDLDHFKAVNDKYGHLSGSRLLGEIGQRLKLHTRSVDMCFRYGGDEFIVLMPGTRKEEAITTSLRLRERLKSHVYLAQEGLNLRISASYGIASYPEDGTTLHSIIGAADASMYSVKSAGRDNVAAAAAAVTRAPRRA